MMTQNSGRKRKLLIGVVVLAVAGLAAVVTRQFWTQTEQAAHKPARARSVSVEIARAEKKAVPFDIDAIGTVTPIASAYARDGMTCRDFLASYVRRQGTETWLQGEACRGRKGAWEVKRLRPWTRS